MPHITVTCPREDCEAEIQLDVSITPGEPAVWGLPENSYPGTGPEVELAEAEPTKCSEDHEPWTKEELEELGKKITEALDEYDFSDGGDERDYDED